MAREEKDSDLWIDVEGIGRFRFGRRTIHDSFRIRGMYSGLTNGFYDADGNASDIAALAYATVRVLLVEEPVGFLDSLDPLLDERCEDRIMDVFAKLREKELSFRPRPAADRESEGKGAGEQLQPLVPGEVLSAADGSALPGGDAGAN